jgi:hypothetical protein
VEAGIGAHACRQTFTALSFLNSSVARMHAGREDFIKVLNQYGIYSETHEFEGHRMLFAYSIHGLSQQ